MLNDGNGNGTLAGPARHPWYWQLKAELDVSCRRVAKEHADETARRMEHSEAKQLEEGKDQRRRVEALERAVPPDLAGQLREMHDLGSRTRATGVILVILIGFALSVIGLILSRMAP